jgi:hypothetical protein
VSGYLAHTHALHRGNKGVVSEVITTMNSIGYSVDSDATDSVTNEIRNI